MEIVSTLRAALANKVGRKRYDLWFGPQTQLSVSPGGLVVEVATPFVQEWLRRHFRKDIEASCLEALGSPLPLEFRVNPALAVASGQGTVDGGQKAQGSGRKADSGATASEVGRASLTSPKAPVSIAAAAAPTNRRRFASLDQFVVGTANRLAHTSALIAVERLGQVSPLLFHGPTGVGKTHLLEGIWTATKKRPQSPRAVYLSAEQFTTHFLEALRGGGSPSFRQKYRGVDLLLIDDVQFFAGKRATLAEVLHTIDTLLREGRQIVLSADRPVNEINQISPELASRLAGGMVCGLEPPDHATRLGIVRQMASKLETSVSDEVLQYVATQLTSHARELAGALNRLEATSQAHSRPITLALAEEALSDMIRTSGRVVRLADVERAVCDAFGLEPETLQADGKSKAISHPRMLAMFLARKHTRAALSEIGRHFGRRSHSTVISAHKTVGGWVKGQEMIDLAGRPCNVEEAIRKIEQNLRMA